MFFGSLEEINRIRHARRLWLLLDYDGTLADFSPTPDDILPDSEVIELLTQLEKQPDTRVAVISGRRLTHIQALLPIPGILLAGTYGIEMLLPDGKRINRLEYKKIRPFLKAFKPEWEGIIPAQGGFYLEDKGWSLAIHARFASDLEAHQILDSARRIAAQFMEGSQFQLLYGHKFLEVGPELADKGLTVDYLLDQFPWKGFLPVYVGDDDKDEKAFTKIIQHDGVAILVSKNARETLAALRLESPNDVRFWLRSLYS